MCLPRIFWSMIAFFFSDAENNNNVETMGKIQEKFHRLFFIRSFFEKNIDALRKHFTQMFNKKEYFIRWK